MIDRATREPIDRLASSRIVALEKALKAEVGGITAELSDRGYPISNMRVTHTKAAGERNLIQRAELIKAAIAQVCEARHIWRAPNLGSELQRVFDEIYNSQRTSVSNYVESVIPNEAKKLCPVGELSPEIGMYREELRLFADNLPRKDYWKNIVSWFRSHAWSVPFVLVVVCLPLLVKWVEMLKAILRWMGISRSIGN